MPDTGWPVPYHKYGYIWAMTADTSTAVAMFHRLCERYEFHCFCCCAAGEESVEWVSHYGYSPRPTAIRVQHYDPYAMYSCETRGDMLRSVALKFVWELEQAVKTPQTCHVTCLLTY